MINLYVEYLEEALIVGILINIIYNLTSESVKANDKRTNVCESNDKNMKIEQQKLYWPILMNGQYSTGLTLKISSVTVYALSVLLQFNKYFAYYV